MEATRFVARRLRFKGKTAMVSIAVSFLVMILAQSISAGFRSEIRRGVAAVSGDVQLGPSDLNVIGEEHPVSIAQSFRGKLDSLRGVAETVPVIYRVGIVKRGEDIHGVLVKGVPMPEDTLQLGVDIPARLASLLHLDAGDEMLTYFVGERVKVRRFRVRSVYPGILDSDENLVVYASLADMQRLNGWTADQASAFEVRLDRAFEAPAAMAAKNAEIGALARIYAGAEDDELVSTSAIQRFPQLFDWLRLIDMNVLVILVLMTVVAGFNMISGLLILLFQNISTIGTLKALGMTDKSISKVFLRVSSNLVLKGMALGNGIALLFCALQAATHFVRLNPRNYFVSFVPVHVNLPAILLADLAAYAVIMLLLWIPTLFISRVDPAVTVRAQ
ncbi:MAG: FtsX-like permease family protein [Bacteroidales bacterium]|nr:FtsX-like permease family protein [Bacteroidales bacterium]